MSETKLPGAWVRYSRTSSVNACSEVLKTNTCRLDVSVSLSVSATVAPRAPRALVALGRGSQFVAVVSLDAHDRLAPLVSQLRPGSSLDDLPVPDVLTSGPPCSRPRGPAVAGR